MEKFLFTPKRELDLSAGVPLVAVKGQTPQADFLVSLKDIYFPTQVYDPQAAYTEICSELYDAVALLTSHELRESIHLPQANSQEQAVDYLNIMFSPFSYGTNDLETRYKNILEKPSGFLLGAPLPFPLAHAEPAKLVHTLGWIDTNIKVSTENSLSRFNLSIDEIERIVVHAFKIYSVVLKQQNYFLANSINFNHSMFLQERILSLILSDAIYRPVQLAAKKGRISNEIVLQLLKGLGDLSLKQLCSLSVFMGVMWTGSPALQNSFATNADLTIAQIETELNSIKDNWCIDQSDDFIRAVGLDRDQHIAVVLDDNGESTVDMALFQHILRHTGNMKITFIVNRYPISNNIALEDFNALINVEYFSDLKQYLQEGRAKVCVENQTFRSFEIEYLNLKTRKVIANAQFAYIKGANFFETFQVTEILRYYCFVSHSYTSQLLTGCPQGKGVFVRLDPGQTAYTFHDYTNYETLLKKINATSGE